MSGRAASPASASASPPRMAWRSAGRRSLPAFVAGAARRGARGEGEVAAARDRRSWRAFRAAVDGGALEPSRELRNLAPAEAAAAIARRARRRLGRAPAGRRRAAWAKRATPCPRPPTRCALPDGLRSLPRQPVYGRAPDARAGGGMMATPAIDARAHRGRHFADLDAVMTVMDDSFGTRFGEAWTRSQCAGILPMAGVSLTLARDARQRRDDRLFACPHRRRRSRVAAARGRPARPARGVGGRLLDDFIEQARATRSRSRPSRSPRRKSCARHVSSGGFCSGRPAPELLLCVRRPALRRADLGELFDLELF